MLNETGCYKLLMYRYENELVKAKATSIRNGIYNGVGFGLFDLSMFGMIGLSFWYGATLIITSQITVANFFSFFAVLVGAFTLGAVSVEFLLHIDNIFKQAKNNIFVATKLTDTFGYFSYYSAHSASPEGPGRLRKVKYYGLADCAGFTQGSILRSVMLFYR